MVSIDRSGNTSTSDILSFDFVTKQRLHSHLQTSKYYLQFNSLHTKLWCHITYPVSVKLYIIQLKQNTESIKLIWWLDRSHCCPHTTFPCCTTIIFNWCWSWNSILQISTTANIDLKFVSNSMLTLRLLMSYIYGAPILDVPRSHTTTQHSR